MSILESKNCPWRLACWAQALVITGEDKNFVARTVGFSRSSISSMMALHLATAVLLLTPQMVAPTPTPTKHPHRNVSSAATGWEQLRAAIDDFQLVENVAVSVGDARGELFRHTKGTTDFSTQMSIASATKWVSGVVVMRAVEEGFLSLDDLASTHLGYWSRDPEDPRSRVTLRHLLSFVSGMSGSTACPTELDFNACIEDMYSRSATQWEPG
jgi:CubicO group peptidase (beta-lactamase class C family)